ncbi:MAG TPA: hypothetical protein VF736_17435 [Pyrinomonadaceae bacterium]|jgi:hypothetical protein
MSDCKVFRGEIEGAADGRALSGAGAAHAAACRACGEELRGRESLRRLVGGLGRVEAPPDFEFRLRARMAASKAGGRRAPLRGLRLVYAFAPVAAAVCFLVFSAALYFNRASRPVSSGAPAAAAVAAQDAAPAEGPAAPEASEAGAERVAVEVTPPAPGRILLASGPRVQVRRAPAVRAREVAAKSEARAAARQNTIITSAWGAPVINGQRVITLTAPAEPLRMILRDERGAGRVVPMRAVSFGSQELIARQGAPRRQAATENEGVW